jgi:hypothetical protein
MIEIFETFSTPVRTDGMAQGNLPLTIRRLDTFLHDREREWNRRKAELDKRSEF